MVREKFTGAFLNNIFQKKRNKNVIQGKCLQNFGLNPGLPILSLIKTEIIDN